MLTYNKFIKNKSQLFIKEDITVDDDRYKTDDGLAYIDIEKSDKNWHICMIESKIKGGGTRLLKRLIDDAKREGIKTITLATTEFSGWGFFDKFGFKEVGDNNDPYDNPMILHL